LNASEKDINKKEKKSIAFKALSSKAKHLVEEDNDTNEDLIEDEEMELFVIRYHRYI
jgi:hypothetical protein